MHIFIKNKKLILGDYRIKCAIGKRGIGNKKREGDQITPKGKFKVKSILQRKDRLSHFKSKITKLPIKRDMGWCDDPKSKQYNKLIKLPFKGSFEKLYRKDHKYDLMIPIKYNYFRPTKYRGSCIFVHLTNDYKATAGCVAIKKKDFFIMLKLINRKTKIKIC